MGAVSRLVLVLWGIQAVGAPALLSETQLYQDITTKTVKATNLPFSPQYPLWTDGASKERWISLPAPIDVTNPEQWIFPVGTKLWKEFSLNGKRVETRLMEKLNEFEWGFSSYLWNADESEATLAPEDGIENYYPLPNGKAHDIPSTTQCLRCHRALGDAVLGFDALGLSSDRDPNALHAEPFSEEDLTLPRLIETQLVSGVPPEFNGGAPAIPGSGRSLLGYFHTNCASCHQSGGSAANLGLQLRHNLAATSFPETRTFLTAINQYAFNFAIPGETRSLRVAPGRPDKSAFYYMLVTEEVSHMPPIGTKVPDTAAIAALKQWIEDL